MEEFVSDDISRETHSHKLIVPCLLKLQEVNTSSHANFEVDNNNHIKHFFFCPGWINQIAKAVRPVVSLECAHLRKIHKGGLYTFVVLNANNEIFTLAFGVAAGSKNKGNWNWFMQQFKE